MRVTPITEHKQWYAVVQCSVTCLLRTGRRTWMQPGCALRLTADNKVRQVVQGTTRC